MHGCGKFAVHGNSSVCFQKVLLRANTVSYIYKSEYFPSRYIAISAAKALVSVNRSDKRVTKCQFGHCE